MRVDHVSIAVASIDQALEFFLELFPARSGRSKSDGYDGQFRWCNFSIGRFKIELIESARPGSFVERFLARRGEGFHHLSLKVDDLETLERRFQRDGLRVVDRFDKGGGSRTSFLHPQSAFGTLIQFWQTSSSAELDEPSWGGTVAKDGVRWQVDHLSLAVHALEPALRFFQVHFGGSTEVSPHEGYDGTFRVAKMRLRDYRLELMEPARPGGFLDRFLARRGPGLHHLSIDVEDLDAVLAPFERRGVRIVDRLDLAPGWRTAFLHPRSAFGTLIQFWQTPLEHWSRELEEPPRGADTAPR